MTLDRVAAQQTILIHFFKLIREEDFEQCFQWAKKALQAKSSAAFTLIDQLENEAVITASSLEGVSDDDILLLFCGCYGFARHEVEESNRYHHAETLVRSSITALTVLPLCGLNKALQKFAAIQIDICRIDRGFYTSQEWLMTEATQNIEAHLVEVDALHSQFSELERQLYTEYLHQEFSSYRYFSDGVSIIAKLCDIRWGDPELLAQKMAEQRPLFLKSVNALTDNDKYIMSTDLEALWPPLAFFSQNRTKGSGELFVERGAISISYFASVNHIVTRELRQSLCDAVNQGSTSHKLFPDSWNAQTPHRNMLNDIWAGIANSFEDIYSCFLPDISMIFRDKEGKGELNFSVELIYYPMGIFALNLKAPLDNVSASGVRHAMSLGTPFAMDQDMRWNAERLGLLEDFAESRFNELALALSDNFDHYTKPASEMLTFNKTDNRFVSVLVDRLVECVDGQYSSVTAKSLKSHFAYPVFVLQQRELRTAVDDWCLRSVTSDEFNLNRDCYNRDEFVYTNHHECIIGLLQQPNWVLEQASEMMDVASAIYNLFHLTNKMLDKQLKLSLEQAAPTLKDKKISAAKLRAQMETLTAEGECLKQFTHDAHWLLDLISAGSMMTFPDHTRMIHKVFEQMDFAKLHTRTQETLSKIQYRQEEIIAETAKLYEKLQTRNSKRLTQVLSGSMALISVGALKDIFDILNNAKIGVHISGSLQVSIVTLFGMMLIILLINKNESDK
ncbi:hypothetical protein [Shewanella youngdeokensis]|uniref:Uncharacterized protein n=1 Tax=Shewanella youngdeokensis TaxID=2999068 RepID=A0ABZ0K0A4_9GAMM|nr:hypothetical protein RGE70_04030 [Shewanella sp. DAU334]